MDNEGRQRFQDKADLDKYRFRKEKYSFEQKIKMLNKNPSSDPFLDDEAQSLTPKIRIKRKLKLKSKKLKKFKSYPIARNLTETFMNIP